MENIDRLVDDKELKGFVKERGLGTPATRASIIEELIAAGYIERKKKQLVSTDYGRAFAASVPDIENGNGNADMLFDEIKNSVSEIIAYEKSRGNRVKVTRKVSVGNCPRCGSPVIENSKAFSCSAGGDKCGFFIFKQDKRIGRSYKADEIAELLSKGKVTLKNCTSSKGNKYSAVFSLEDTGKYVNLKMEEFADGKKKRGA